MPLLEKDKEILLSQSGSKTSAEWEAFFDGKYPKKQLWDFCNTHNVKMKKMSKEDFSKLQSQRARKYNINQDYFKTWTRNMAYMFGFWFADGCIYRGRMFDITVHKKDKYILKKLAEELQFEGKLYDYVDRQAARIDFSCKVIYDDIVALGGKECKSLDCEFPEVPKEYLPDFIRGYFDGDGCAYIGKNNGFRSSFASGSPKFLAALHNILKEEAGIVGGGQSKWQLSFGKRDSKLLAQYMYKDNPELFLKRKRDKFQAIGETYQAIPSHPIGKQGDVETNYHNRY